MRFFLHALRRSCALALFSVLPVFAAPAPEPLEIGVLPYVGVDELVKAYGPLARHLETELKRPVRIVTARDYAAFLAETSRQAYPLLVTGSHFARLAEQDGGYDPLLRPLTTYHVLLLVPRDSPARRIEDLREARIAIPDALSQTAMMARVLLHEHGIDTSPRIAGNHKNALLAVLRGEADACVVSAGAFRHMREEDKQGLRELRPAGGQPREAIPLIVAASTRLPTIERVRLARMIARFANYEPAGRAWIGGLKYEGLKPVTAADLRGLDADVRQLRRVLGEMGEASGR